MKHIRTTAALALLTALHPAAADEPNRFSLELLKQADKQHHGNICIAPCSAAAPLLILEKGAAGATRQQIADTLGGTEPWLPSLRQQKGNSLQTAQIHVDANFPLKQEFRNAWPKQTLISLDIRNAPDKARTAINNYIRTSTSDAIRELLPPDSVNGNTAFIAVSALRYRSHWLTPFAKRYTVPRPFTLPGGTTKTVPTMHKVASFNYVIDPQYSAVELPYRTPPEGSAQAPGSMIAILPPEGTAIEDFISTLTPETIADMRKKLAASQNGRNLRDIVLAIPKFTISSATDLSKALPAMGMPDAFQDTADFSGISPTPGLKINGFHHQCNIAVDEKGTVVTAASSTDAPFGSPPRLDFKLNRPFLWLIVPNSSDPAAPILILGIVREP